MKDNNKRKEKNIPTENTESYKNGEENGGPMVGREIGSNDKDSNKPKIRDLEEEKQRQEKEKKD